MFLWCSNFCFIQIRYHHSFSPGMEFFCNCTKHRITVETSGPSARNARVIQGGPGACSPRKMFENLTLGNAISCIHWIERSYGNSYVYFVELFSESRYLLSPPSRSTRIHNSQVFLNKNSGFLYVLLLWFMIHDSASTPDRIKRLTNICLWKVKKIYMYRLYSVLNNFAVHFARQAQLGAHGCQKLFWLIQHSGLTLFVNWVLT